MSKREFRNRNTRFFFVSDYSNRVPFTPRKLIRILNGT